MSMRSRDTSSRRGPGRRGPMGRHGPMAMMMRGEKAHDFRGTMIKLIQYLGAYRQSVVIVMIFAAASTVFAIVGPKILGRATTKLFEGVMSQIAVTSNNPLFMMMTSTSIIVPFERLIHQ